jgi:hypothetical protein
MVRRELGEKIYMTLNLSGYFANAIHQTEGRLVMTIHRLLETQSGNYKGPIFSIIDYLHVGPFIKSEIHL